MGEEPGPLDAPELRDIPLYCFEPCYGVVCPDGLICMGGRCEAPPEDGQTDPVLPGPVRDSLVSVTGGCSVAPGSRSPLSGELALFLGAALLILRRRRR